VALQDDLLAKARKHQPPIIVSRKNYTTQCSFYIATGKRQSRLPSALTAHPDRTQFMTAPKRLTDLKRSAIVQAAISEFRTSGFEITSMDKIAATAGVSKRTVYNHFPSKEELFAEILHKLWASISAQSEIVYCSDLPLRQQLENLLRAKLQLLAMAAGRIKPILPELGREAHDWISRPKRHGAAFNYYARQNLKKHADCLN